jgi:DNA polymerase/3'-5' exonuclease PolX
LLSVILYVYVAALETRATLLLIQTESKEHNIMLRKKTRELGMKIHTDALGLFKIITQDYDDSDSEEPIFKELGSKYLKPEERG